MAGWISWLEHCPIDQKVARSILDHSTYLGGVFDSQGVDGRQQINVSLSHRCVCLSLKINEHILR